MQDALIIFVRNPELGKVKTRLAATIGDVAALRIYNQLLVHTRNISEAVARDKFIFYAPAITEEDMWFGDGYFKCTQAAGDLGYRMQEAFQHVFSKGYKKAVIIGSDCIELTPGIIEDAYLQLNQRDLVIGPAVDGGYYLLGMKTLYPELFANKKWSTDSVFAETIAAVKALGLTYAAMPLLNDVDEEKDVPAAWL